MSIPRPRARFLAALLTPLLGACQTGPDYVRPDPPPLPSQWKQGEATGAGWQLASPRDEAPKEAWWQGFADPILDDLESRALTGNPGIALALSRLDQASAQAAARGAAQSPTVALGASASRSRISADRPLTNYSSTNYSTVQNDLKPVLTVSYEIDWLGRIRRDLEGAKASVEASRADLENVRLVLTAQVAATYLQLRQFDSEIRLQEAALAAQRKVLGLITARRQEGLTGENDEVLQAALVAGSEAQLALLNNSRKLAEDSLGTLVGEAAAGFRLAPGSLPSQLPPVPLGVPASLLERRPDIASAERAMAAANAQIGVARAAYYPSLTLAPTQVGFEATGWSQLFSTPALVWSLGLQLGQTLFDGGRIQAGVEVATAAYQGTLASYRQTVLTAIQETQDALNTLEGLDIALARQREGVAKQSRSLEIIGIRYREGLDSAMTLTLAQQNLLAAQRTEAQLQGARLTATVALLKALGGPWAARRQAGDQSPR